MKIPINQKYGLFSLVATSLEEYDNLQDINKVIQMANTLSFVGPEFYLVLPIGGVLSPVNLRPTFLKFIKRRKVIVPTPELSDSYRGVPVEFSFKSIPLVVKAAMPEDEVNIWRIWTSCYYGGFEPVFIESRFPKGNIEMEFFLGNCKNCGRFCVDLIDLQYMCSDCAAKCNHSYDFFIACIEKEDGGRKRLVGQFCIHCRRPNPDFNPEMFSSEEQEALIQSLLS